MDIGKRKRYNMHHHTLFLRGYFRVQRNLFNSLWNLKTLILKQHSERGSENMCGLRVKNVCLLECGKKVLNYEVQSIFIELRGL